MLSKYNNTHATDEPTGVSFVNYYSKLANEPMVEKFDMDNENEIKNFFLAYDNKFISQPVLDKTEYEILNCNVTNDEIENAIDALKNNTAVGGHMIPAEFLKHNKNNIIEKIFVRCSVTLLKWKHYLTHGWKVSVHLFTKLVWCPAQITSEA